MFHRAPPLLGFLGNKAGFDRPCTARPAPTSAAGQRSTGGRCWSPPGVLPLHRLGLLDAIAFTCPDPIVLLVHASDSIFQFKHK